MNNHFWIGVVSKAHVMKGVKDGIAQLNHGKKVPLAKMKAGDWIVYYSPRLSLQDRQPYQYFTAIGKVTTGEVYQYDTGNGFMPYRLDVDFAACREVSILPLLDKLSFTQGKKNWGQQFRFGHFEISKSDFLLLANDMGVNIDSNTLE